MNVRKALRIITDNYPIAINYSLLLIIACISLWQNNFSAFCNIVIAAFWLTAFVKTRK